MRVLPRPYPDELLYSVIARTAYHYGYWSPTQLLLPLFGSRAVIAVPDLPSNLASLTERTFDAWGLSAEDVAARHTLLGYYTYFQGQNVRQAVLASMCERGGFNQVRLGVCAGSALSPKRFRLCPQCYEEDRARYGEAYWHRSHQLPGVLVCDRHGVVLQETNVPFRPAGRHEYVAAPQDLSHTHLHPLAGTLQRSEFAQRIAMRSALLLQLAPRGTDALPDYTGALASRGFTRKKGTADRLRETVRRCCGADLAEASFRTEKGRDPLQWLEEVLRRPRRAMHPYRHVFMEVFLEECGEVEQDPLEDDRPVGRRWGLYRDPSLRHEAALMARQGFTTHAIAQALDVDWKTAKRLVDPTEAPAGGSTRVETADREAWTRLANEHPGLGKKGLRQMQPALYARLYRHDPAWLREFRAGGPAASQSRPRVDWVARDARLCGLIRERAQAIREQVPLRRVSRRHILGCLDATALVAHRADKLPRTIEALGEVCESVEAFQVRRLTKVLAEHTDATAITSSKALWEARIDSSRLADGGCALLAIARARVDLSRIQGDTNDGD